MTKRYRNPVHRSLFDENWEGDDDGYEYEGPHRLRRNKIDGVFGGVCAGLADYFGTDVVIVRIITVLLFFFLLGPLVLIGYFLMWIFVPKDKRAPYYREYREAKKARRKSRERRSDEEASVVRTATFRDVKSKFRSLEERLQDLERSVTSKEWRLRREFRDLEG